MFDFLRWWFEGHPAVEDILAWVVGGLTLLMGSAIVARVVLYFVKVRKRWKEFIEAPFQMVAKLRLGPLEAEVEALQESVPALGEGVRITLAKHDELFAAHKRGLFALRGDIRDLQGGTESQRTKTSDEET